MNHKVPRFRGSRTRFVLAFMIALCAHVLAGLLLSVSLSTSTNNPHDVPRITVSVDLVGTDLGGAKEHTGPARAKKERLIPAAVQTTTMTGNASAAISEKPLGEAPPVLKGEPQTTVMEGPEHPSASGGEPPYLIDTPPKFVERGPISFPQEIKNLTESTSVIVYLSLSATAEILSIEAVAKGVDELRVEVIKMILRSKFSPAYVGKIPVPCVARCVVSILCKPVDQ